MDAAAKQAAAVAAKRNLPEWPAYCRELIPLVDPKPNDLVWGIQARWENVRTNYNRRIVWCGQFYDRLAQPDNTAVAKQ